MTSLVLPHGPHWGSTGELPDIATVETSDLVRLRVRLDSCLKNGTIMVAVGRFGAGKSYSLARAVEDVAPNHDVEVVWLEMPPVRAERDQWRELHYEILGSHPSKSASVGEITRIVKDVLGERKRLLVLDEAQEAKVAMMKQLRWLHEAGTTKFSLVFCGTPNLWYDLLPGEIISRAGHKVAVTGVADDEAESLLPTFHPIFESADPDDLRRWNLTRARGSFRWWARVLQNAVEQLPYLPSTRLDEAAMASICSDIPEGNR